MPQPSKIADAIRVVGARVHNLKNLDVEIPLNALTVVTGVSGSGKSSLAFDTIYAEGQRRYVESLSAYARQFLERMEKPDVDSIDGIAPAVAIRQKSSSRNPRSTVATATEIYDYLRLLYARVGETICPDCNLVAERHDVDTAIARLFAAAPGRRALLLFPATPPAGESPAAYLQSLRARGFTRVLQTGKTFDFSAPESLLDLQLDQPFSVLLDRLVIEPESRARIVEAIETAYHEAGEIVVQLPDAPAASLRFHPRLECTQCRKTFETPEPIFFAFNSPAGACPRCQGFGRSAELDEARVIPDPRRTLDQGAIEPWTKPARAPWRNALKRVANAANIPLDKPWNQLSDQQRRWLWNGVGKFPGVVGFFQRLERKKYKVHVRVMLSRYRTYQICPDCGGQRLRPEALWVRLRSTASPQPLNLPQVVGLTVDQAREFFDGLILGEERAAIAATILIEVRRRVEFLRKVGLNYLTLDRLASTLSGGESQRIQLASCLGSQLVGSLYVLDEPSIGLHPRDTARLISILHQLRDLGNSILVVEHDPEMMRASDHILDLGPGAGEAGGALVASGTWRQITRNPASLTGQYLSGKRALPAPPRRSPGRNFLEIQGARIHNLKNLDVEIPLGLLVAITGVSGSGKSTLVHDVLHENLKRALHLDPPLPGRRTPADPVWTHCSRIRGLAHLQEIVLVDQSPIGRSPRSNPVTYLKAFDGIRELFARQPEAKRRGLKAGDFSFNVPGGRCETCQGDGVVTVDMQFLADVELVCDECNGTRYQASTLAVEFQGKNIHQVLQMSVHAALSFFAAHEKIVRPLRVLNEIGLGYLRLGQSATTLSGGEAQRVKLASFLAQPRASNRTLFLLDEPTTGLHFDDIAKLLAALQRLLDAGASVVVIEHNLEVIRAADWIIDLGPEGGDAGGELVAEGPPDLLAAHPRSHLAPFLS